jgi:predicted DNA-binding ribbon-helix-helix protein
MRIVGPNYKKPDKDQRRYGGGDELTPQSRGNANQGRDEYEHREHGNIEPIHGGKIETHSVLPTGTKTSKFHLNLRLLVFGESQRREFTGPTALGGTRLGVSRRYQTNSIAIPNHRMRVQGATGGAQMKSSVVKRSIVIDGHKTSVSLEDAFWSDLKQIALAQRATRSELVAKIDEARQQNNLSSAIRLFVLEHVRNGSAGRLDKCSLQGSAGAELEG